MSKQAFASAIINKMKGAISTDGQSFNGGTANAAMIAVAQAITEYLMANTIVTISYAGIIPGTPPSPDPVVTDTFKIIGTCAPPSASENFDEWLLQLENNIIAGFTLAPLGTAGVVFQMVPFLTAAVTTKREDLKSAHDVSDSDPQQKIWEIICDGIMQWVNNTAINPTPGAATHPPAGSAGQAFITKITLT